MRNNTRRLVTSLAACTVSVGLAGGFLTACGDSGGESESSATSPEGGSGETIKIGYSA